MSGQMCWLGTFSSETKILHLRLDANQPWKPYTAFRDLAAPDYPVPGGSKGFATFHKLRRAGWELIATEQAKQTFGSTPLISPPKAA